MDGIPEVRTMIDVHITLLTEFGWIVGWAWFAFIMMSLSGVLLRVKIAAWSVYGCGVYPEMISSPASALITCGIEDGDRLRIAVILFIVIEKPEA